MSQSEHEAWNARNFPGTRQLCAKCGEPTGRCEDDSLYADDDREDGPLCDQCWNNLNAAHDGRGKETTMGLLGTLNTKGDARVARQGENHE
jgi:hypothetical protein